MNIIVPINIEGLRVSPSTTEFAKTSLYDFTLLGQNPLSAQGDLIAANRFMTAQTAMSIEPGIHIHWSLPKAYTRGNQDQQTGNVAFPVMPNRWLVIRFLKDNTQPAGSNTSIRLWILESDAHSGNSASVNNSKYSIPWMDNSTDIQGLQFNYIGNKIDLTGNWTEPSGNGSMKFLGSSFQAPFGYGETFTAYYQNSGNVLGLYDDLRDHFSQPAKLEINTDFSASYAAMGWVNSTAADECHQVLNEALTQYNALPDPKPDFTSFIQGIIENELRWSLSDYSSLTTATTGQVQAVMSGILASVQWKIQSPGNPAYPDALPDSTGINITVGNNTIEAISAYFNAIEKPKIGQGGNDITSNIEWLLNALQYNKLHKFSAGATGVGQLEEYLHGTAFGAEAGGYCWSVRKKMDPTQKPVEGADNEITIPVYLAKILSQLNSAQKGLDTARYDIESRRKQLFFDWTYHIKSINDNVIKKSAPLSSDNSGTFLVDGLAHLFPFMMKAGNYQDSSAPNAPYSPTPDSFSILAPAIPVANLSEYVFNQTGNLVAGSFIQTALNMGLGVDETGDENLPDAQDAISRALSMLLLFQQGGNDADSYFDQANTQVQNALTALNISNTTITGLQTGGTSLSTLLTQVTQAKSILDKLLDPTTGVFATALQFTSTQQVPLAAGVTYTGTISFSTLQFLNSWQSPVQGFPGMKAQMDIFSGQNGNPVNLFEIQTAALYLGIAYLYQQSGLSSACVCAYYLQMAQQEIIDSQTAASTAIAKITQAMNALATPGVSAFINCLEQIISTAIPAIQADLETKSPESIKDAIQKLLALLNTDSGSISIPALRQEILSAEWESLRNGIDDTTQAVAGRLPMSQQVEQWNKFLYQQISGDFQLEAVPADRFARPTDPVLLLVDQDANGELLKPPDRNGLAPKLPCRLDAEIVAASGSINFPAIISNLQANLQTGIPGMSTTLQNLAMESYLLTPEYAAVVTAANLQAAAASNKTIQYNKFNDVELNAPPAGLTGKLPYYIAFNWLAGKDMFLPLFIWWETEYQYSQTYMFGPETYPDNYLSLFQLGKYEADLQPLPGSMAGFNQNLTSPNFFSTHGLISLSSSSTSNLCGQIQTYCTTYLGFDPALGPPPPTLPDYDEALKFYKTYSDYKTRNILSQGLSGFNQALAQRAEELQIPINIPQSWTTASGGGLNIDNLWPTSFLHGQSQNWDINWNADGINNKVYFNPLRAGFMQLKSVFVVDVFGRFVDLTIPSPIIKAESMTCDQPPPAGHDIYLAPRLVQPSRLNFNWLSASSPGGIGSFTELNHHPAASPVCGWIFPNHLDDSLMLYDATGLPLGSLGRRNTDLHWFPVPGETTTPGANNRDQMVDYITAKNANPVFRNFLEQFLYADSTPASEKKLENFLNVLSLAQQFIITPSMQQDKSLAVLMGQPLVITQALISIEQKGEPFTGLDSNTYPVWNQSGPQFTLTSSEFIPYNPDNFNQGNITNVQVPVRVGSAEIQASLTSIPYFDDGLAGFFMAEDYSTLYTPVDIPDSPGITSTFDPGKHPLSLTVNGAPALLTMIMDPRAAVHATTGVLPAGSISIPEDQYQKTIDQLEISFLAAPVLAASNPPGLPLPGENGFQWYWQQIGIADQGPLRPDQRGTDAFFPQTPQQLIDGWLKLKKNNTK